MTEPKKHPRVLQTSDLELMASRRTEAWTEISQICGSEKRWQMRIPVDPTDSDEVFGRVLTDSLTLEREIYRLRAAIKNLMIEHYGDIKDLAINDAMQAVLWGTED